MRFCVLILTVGALVLAGCGPGNAEAEVRELEEFTSIRTCLPFNLLIKPSEKGELPYSITIDTGKSHIPVSSVVEESVLTVTTTTGFEVTAPIKVTISLPSTKLVKIFKSAAADLVVAAGFDVPSLDVQVNGIGQLIIYDLTTDDLLVAGQEIASTAVEGTIKKARVSGGDTSTIYLKGVMNTVEASLRGVSKLYIVSGSDNLLVTGQAKSLARVFLTKGICAVRGDFAFRRSCYTIPVQYPESQPLFSCGVLADGGINCSPESASSSIFLSTGSTGSSAFASSSSGSFGSIFSSSSSSFGGSSKTRSSSSSSSASSSSFSSSRTFGVDTLISSRTSSFSSSSSTSAFSSASTSTSSKQDESETAAVAVVSTMCDAESEEDLKML